jgi:hypothetical protein
MSLYEERRCLSINRVQLSLVAASEVVIFLIQAEGMKATIAAAAEMSLQVSCLDQGTITMKSIPLAFLQRQLRRSVNYLNLPLPALTNLNTITLMSAPALMETSACPRFLSQCRTDTHHLVPKIPVLMDIRLPLQVQALAVTMKLRSGILAGLGGDIEALERLKSGSWNWLMW